jgi:hypothetical protein
LTSDHGYHCRPVGVDDLLSRVRAAGLRDGRTLQLLHESPGIHMPFATGAYNYITNDYGISYTHSGICVDTVQSTGKIWKRTCTSGNESLTCNGNEYEIFGYGETVATEGPTKQNLAGTQNNYHYCTRK